MIGKRFGYREHPHTPGGELRPVEVIKEGPRRSTKVRIRWLDGEYEGLDEWIPKVRLVVPWEEAEAFLADERHMLAAVKASGDVYRSREWRAVEEVFFAVPGEPSPMLGYGAIESDLLVIEQLNEVAARLGIEPDELLAEPHAYLDRFGHYRAPFSVALRVARVCCQRLAPDVLRYVQAEEDAIRQAIVTGYYVAANTSSDIEYELAPEQARKRLGEDEPVFALIRQWCGAEAYREFREVVALRGEVERLRGLTKESARWMRETGHAAKSSWLLRQLDSGKAGEPRDGRPS